MKHLPLKQAIQRALFPVLFLLAASSCNKNQPYYQGSNNHPGGNTSVRVFLTDDPSLVFDHVFIDILKVEIKAEDSSELEHEREHQDEVDGDDENGSSSGGWIALDIHPGIYDVLNFRNGLDTLFGTGTFPSTHELKKLRLTLGNNNSVVFGGQTFPLVVKDNNNMVVIKLDDSFAGAGSLAQLDFTMDFDAGQSIRLHGDRFELRSQIKAFRKEHVAGIEGRVLPAEARAMVYAIQGTDTATAKPEAEGEFKIVGLKPGTYSLTYHATAGNFQDTVIQNIIVSANEDAHIGTVTLHP